MALSLALQRYPMLFDFTLLYKSSLGFKRYTVFAATFSLYYTTGLTHTLWP